MSQTFKHHFACNFTFFVQILGVLLLCSIVLITLYLACYSHLNLISFISTLFAHAHTVSPTLADSDPLGGNVVTSWR